MQDTNTINPTGTYAIDASHSRIGFVARHAMVTKVRGSFNDFTGEGHFDLNEPSNSKVSLTIQATSIDTRNGDRDGHLRSSDFFDMEQFPEISFASTAVERDGDATYAVTGDLTIKGVTNSVTVELGYEGTALDLYGNQRIGFDGKAVINRKDWGISFNAPLETGGVLIGEKITLEFEVSAILAQAD